MSRDGWKLGLCALFAGKSTGFEQDWISPAEVRWQPSGAPEWRMTDFEAEWKIVLRHVQSK